MVDGPVLGHRPAMFAAPDEMMNMSIDLQKLATAETIEDHLIILDKATGHITNGGIVTITKKGKVLGVAETKRDFYRLVTM